MDADLKNEGFDSISIKTSVAQKFRKFCKAMGKSQSLTLLLMLEFFEENKISPTESLGPNMKSLEASIRKRIDALIAIVRNIEKDQIKPTKAMLEAIFEEVPATTSKNQTSSFEEAFKNLERTQNNKKINSRDSHLRDVQSILRNIETVQPAFGKPYFKILLKSDEIKQLKNKYHVYHH